MFSKILKVVFIFMIIVVLLRLAVHASLNFIDLKQIYKILLKHNLVFEWKIIFEMFIDDLQRFASVDFGSGGLIPYLPLLNSDIVDWLQWVLNGFNQIIKFLNYVIDILNMITSIFILVFNLVKDSIAFIINIILFIAQLLKNIIELFSYVITGVSYV